MLRQKIVLGNWKMHGSLVQNHALVEELGRLLESQSSELAIVRYGVAVPALYVQQLRDLLVGSSILLGAQDVSPYAHGAYTGEISAVMLKELGVDFCLVGHSERRAYHGESSQVVAQKMLALLSQGIMPVVCVGETLAEREGGQTEAVVLAQLAAVLDVLTQDSLQNVVFAYEPVWAIGTGRTATPEQAQSVHELIRSAIQAKFGEASQGVQIVYGGSVSPDNAQRLFAQTDIDGGLVGGASLVADKFANIILAAVSKA